MATVSGVSVLLDGKPSCNGIVYCERREGRALRVPRNRVDLASVLEGRDGMGVPRNGSFVRRRAL